MKLQTVHIRDFRCIDDSTEFRMDEVTALVGKNESGKTTILAAMEKLNPVITSRGSFTTLDYPRKKWRPNESVPVDPPAISTKWHLTQDELKSVDSAFCKGCLSSPEVKISKSYDNILRVEPAIDEPACVNAILGGVGITRDKLSDTGPLDLSALVAYSFPDTIPAEMSAAATAACLKKYPKRRGFDQREYCRFSSEISVLWGVQQTARAVVARPIHKAKGNQWPDLGRFIV